MANMRDLGRTVAEWLDSGHRVAVARVVDVKGFGAVPAGEVLAIRDDGERAGSLLRGVADAVVEAAFPAAMDGTAAVVTAPVAENAAVAAGLACAGSARILVHQARDRTVWSALAAGLPAALATTLATGAELAVGPEGVSGSLGDPARDAEARERAAKLLDAGATGRAADAEILVDAWTPTPTVVTVGGGLLGQALAAQAALLGWDARDVSSVEEAVAAVEAFGPADALVLLDHNPAMDAALRAGLAHGRGFLGALGSRRTQAARRERLLAAGVRETDLSWIHGPVGLDLGARSPAETAVSIVAEILATRSGRSGAVLSETSVAIH
jgi:xanthine dehydrogenase accessory factor